MKTKSRIVETVKSLLKAGMSPKKVSLCIAVGIVLGIFPVIGTSTLLCTVAAVAFRLNFPLIQAVNYAVYPLQILLLAPFIATGSRLFGDRRVLNVGKDLIDQLQHDPWGSLVSLWDLLLWGVAVWAIVCPLIVLLTYMTLKPLVVNLTASPRINARL